MRRFFPKFLLPAVFCLPVTIYAQAWLPAKGEGYFSLTYQSMFSGDHLFGDGTISNPGPGRSSVVSAGFFYGLTDRLTISSDMPYVAPKFTLAPGRVPSAHDLEAKHDDGRYHGTWQDLRAAARYNAVRGPLMLTPFFEVVIPTRHYETFGHAAAGKYLREYRVGAHAGRLLQPVLPRAYFDLRYAYHFVQSVAGLNLDRSTADLEVGYFLKRYFSLRAFGGVQKTHGGLETPVPASSPFFHVHDRVERAHFSRLGGGASFTLPRHMDVHAFFVSTLSGKSIHANKVLGVGMSRSFGRRAAGEDDQQNAAPESPPPADQLATLAALRSAQ